MIINRKGKQYQIQPESGKNLLEILQENDIYISAACGGKGKCGKCKVCFESGATPATADDEHFFDADELARGLRLACLSYPSSDAVITLDSDDESEFDIMSTFENESTAADALESAYHIAIDIGTTTIAVALVGADSGNIIDTATTINHQRAYGADVISRIQAANEGKLDELTNSIRNDLYQCIAKVSASVEQIQKVIIAGNTTMGHLFMNFSCETLGVVPFTPVDISTIRRPFRELFGAVKDYSDRYDSAEVILMPGISTYVGADISSGMLSTGFDRSETVNVLIDLGTNGEMGIGNKDKILVTSTAAGPAFEGGNISCGMGSVNGAICGVSIADDNTVSLKTINDKAPVGLCGTGVIETVCELVEKELIDETGMLDEDYFDDGFVLAQTPDGEDIAFTQQDVREIQLAKSAVRAGLETLILRYGVSYDDIGTVYLAGGFGYHIDVHKAVGIGIIPEELEEKVRAVGNSSLGGAVTYLKEADAPARIEKIVADSEEISLATDKDFNNFYMEHMFFE